MSDKSPLVSVVMPVYNTEEYVAEAIESILVQTFTDFEFIIIDDGSKDKSLEIIKDYARKDDRIRVVQNKENLGIVKSLNKGVELSKGKYIARMDADDISLPERFTQQVNYLEDHQYVNVLGGQIDFINPSGEQVPDEYFYPSVVYRWHVITTLTAIAHPSVMMRKSVLLDCGLYPSGYRYSEDRALWGRMAIRQDFCMHNLQRKILKYRLHFMNVSNQHKQLSMNSSLKARKYPIEQLLGKSMDDQFSKLLLKTDPSKLAKHERYECVKVLKDVYKAIRKNYYLNKTELRVTRYDYVRRISSYITYDRFNYLFKIFELFFISPRYFISLTTRKYLPFFNVPSFETVQNPQKKDC